MLLKIISKSELSVNAFSFKRKKNPSKPLLSFMHGQLKMQASNAISFFAGNVYADKGCQIRFPFFRNFRSLRKLMQVKYHKSFIARVWSHFCLTKIADKIKSGGTARIRETKKCS